MIINIIGWLGSILLVSASFPQVKKVYSEGNAHGMHLWYLLLIWFGLICMDVYVSFTTVNIQLIVSYTIQFMAFSFLIWRKKYPKYDET